VSSQLASFIEIPREVSRQIDFPFNGTIEGIRLVQMFSPVGIPTNG
jgi:hypothetical protein